MATRNVFSQPKKPKAVLPAGWVTGSGSKKSISPPTQMQQHDLVNPVLRTNDPPGGVDLFGGKQTQDAVAAITGSANTTNPASAPWYDSTYAQVMANALKTYQQGLGDLSTADARDQEDLNTNVERLSRNRGDALTSATNSANKQGLLYSGVLTKRRGDVERDYGDREADLRRAVARAIQDRAGQRTTLGNTYGEVERNARQEAITRALERAGAAPVDESATQQGSPSSSATLLEALAALTQPKKGSKASSLLTTLGRV